MVRKTAEGRTVRARVSCDEEEEEEEEETGNRPIVDDAQPTTLEKYPFPSTSSAVAPLTSPPSPSPCNSRTMSTTILSSATGSTLVVTGH